MVTKNFISSLEGRSAPGPGVVLRHLSTWQQRLCVICNRRTRAWSTIADFFCHTTHLFHSRDVQAESSVMISSLACMTCSTVREPLFSASTHV